MIPSIDIARGAKAPARNLDHWICRHAPFVLEVSSRPPDSESRRAWGADILFFRLSKMFLEALIPPATATVDGLLEHDQETNIPRCSGSRCRLRSLPLPVHLFRRALAMLHRHPSSLLSYPCHCCFVVYQASISGSAVCLRRERNTSDYLLLARAS